MFLTLLLISCAKTSGYPISPLGHDSPKKWFVYIEKLLSYVLGEDGAHHSLSVSLDSHKNKIFCSNFHKSTAAIKTKYFCGPLHYFAGNTTVLRPSGKIVHRQGCPPLPLDQGTTRVMSRQTMTSYDCRNFMYSYSHLYVDHTAMCSSFKLVQLHPGEVWHRSRYLGNYHSHRCVIANVRGPSQNRPIGVHHVHFECKVEFFYGVMNCRRSLFFMSAIQWS